MIHTGGKYMGRNYSNVGSWHLRWQNEMLESCHNKGQIEKHFDFGKIHHIVDFQLKNICMEFQHSILHSIDFRKRSEFYTLNDKKLIWIFDVREDFRRGHLKILSEDTQTKKAKISWSTYQECLNSNQ